LPTFPNFLLKLFFGLFLMCLPQSDAVTYISICSKNTLKLPIGSHPHFSFIQFPNGQERAFTISRQLPQQYKPECENFVLPVAFDEIEWGRLVSDSLVQQASQGLLLSSQQTEKPDVQSTILSLDDSNAPDEVLNSPKLPAASPVSMPQHTSPSRPTSLLQLSTWLWEPTIWLNQSRNRLWFQLRDAKIQRVYISIPIHAKNNLPKHIKALKTFIRKAQAHHVAVWAVEGDPRMILPSARQSLLRRLVAYEHYNRLVAPEEQLAGLQYDIEPYLIPGFELNPQSAYRAYLETLSAARTQSSLPLDAVLPFWIMKDTLTEKNFMAELALVVDSITVMDYRTDPDQIVQFAQPFLHWGVLHHKKVQIALEAGPLPGETQYAYYPASSGALWHLQLNSHHIFLLLKNPAPNPSGQSFAFSHQKTVDASNITFANDMQKLIVLLPGLQQTFSAWPSFQGLALHQYLEISKALTSVTDR
jgi:hypothetical protein